MTIAGAAVATHDVVIVGDGPAGCATALSLRAHAPRLSVALVAATRAGVERIGETLPPIAVPMLEQLGVMPAFMRQRHRETYGTAAAWGTPRLHDNDFLFMARGSGWHLDRAAFDAMLLRETRRRGVTVLEGTRAHVVSSSACHRLVLSELRSLTARVVVDATGTGAGIARAHGARSIVEDRLTGYTCFLDAGSSTDPRTIVEAFEHGWWYTAALPGGRRVVSCMTDADIGRRLRLSAADGWAERLALTQHVAGAARGGAVGPIIVRAARSRRLGSVTGDGWLAVGDAASSVDPLSSQGICRAVRAGIFASYAIGDALMQGKADAMLRYSTFVEAEFEQYLAARSRYYAMERRWPDSEFWRRRHGRMPELQAARAGLSDTFVADRADYADSADFFSR